MFLREEIPGVSEDLDEGELALPGVISNPDVIRTSGFAACQESGSAIRLMGG